MSKDKAFSLPPGYSRTALIHTVQKRRKVTLFRFQKDGEPTLLYRWVMPNGALKPMTPREFSDEVNQSLKG